jgi:FxLD family lantipeptide
MSTDSMAWSADPAGDLARPLSGGVGPDSDPFYLDITFIEHGPGASMIIAMTDDGCGTSCPNACTTSASG